MQERGAQIVLLARAFEEVDREGRVLTLDQRAAATRHAMMVTTMQGGWETLGLTGREPGDETVLRRARLIFNALCRRVPSLYRVLEFARLRSLMGPVVVAVALLLGLAANLFDPAGRLRMPPYPLLVLLVWNAMMYAGMLALNSVRPLTKRYANPRESLARHPLARGLAGVVVRLALWRSQVGWRQTARETPAQAHVTSRAFTRFCALWHRLAAQLLEMRVRRMMHLAALSIVVGVVIGMYIRGFTFDYRATWQVQLLGQAQLEMLLGWMIGPAAALHGVVMPPVGSIRLTPDEAKLWLDLYATTALLFVVLPRAGMAAYTAWRCKRLASELPLNLEDHYFQRLLHRRPAGVKQPAS